MKIPLISFACLLAGVFTIPVYAGEIRILDAEHEIKLTYTEGHVTIYDFTADWDGRPMNEAKALLTELAKDPKINVPFVVDNSTDDLKAFEQFKVSDMPHILVLDGNGKQVAVIVGYQKAKITDAVMKAKGQLGWAPSPTSTQPNLKGSAADRLRELQKLKEDGLITETEYQQKRAELLKEL